MRHVYELAVADAEAEAEARLVMSALPICAASIDYDDLSYRWL
jgi:hypothetical protein